VYKGNYVEKRSRPIEIIDKEKDLEKERFCVQVCADSCLTHTAPVSSLNTSVAAGFIPLSPRTSSSLR
jgi:hypothetical protein